jgi:hypothetical protein
MKIILFFIGLFCSVVVQGQISDKEQWRYVNLNTSLLNLIISEMIYTDSTGKNLTENEIYSTQIEKGEIVFDNSLKKPELKLISVNDSVINGCLLSGAKDTLELTLNDGYYPDFQTEVKINGRWFPFQINKPFNCGMGVGKGRLFPNYKCKLILNRTTKGKIKLPFRLKLQLNKKKIYSNEIEISCSREQYKMIPKRIKEYTF